jgi:hypothetical protein
MPLLKPNLEEKLHTHEDYNLERKESSGNEAVKCRILNGQNLWPNQKGLRNSAFGGVTETDIRKEK